MSRLVDADVVDHPEVGQRAVDLGILDPVEGGADQGQ
jgi:hypothetical protein